MSYQSGDSSSSSEQPKRSSGNGTVVDQIVAFLQSKGLNNAAIAGILGNLQVESNFNTHAYNGNEGAIGLAQWEGGRRANLQAWAASHGGSETDLNIQLGFLWHELTNDYSGVYAQLQSVTSASTAAAIWDGQYEVSSGSTRQQRIDNAVSFAHSGLSGAGFTGSGGNGSGSGGPTAADFSNVDGLGSLLNTIPELKQIMQEAVAEGWDLAKFQNAIESSHWFKTHSDTVRSALAQQANDPAAWAQRTGNLSGSILDLARKLGFAVSTSDIQRIASAAIMTGHEGDTAWITHQLSAAFDPDNVTSKTTYSGQMAATVQQLQGMASDYGYKFNPQQLSDHAQAIVGGMSSLDTAKQQFQAWAESAFPSLAKQIEGGQTVKQLAMPYVQSMSNLLEIDPGTLDTFTPQIRKALQGVADPSTGQRATVPLWQFEDQIRQDPRWQYTQNAKDTMSTALVKLGSDFGFGPNG